LTSPTPQAVPLPIRSIEPPPRRTSTRTSILLASLGGVEIVALYLAWRPKLPPEVAVHFGVTGRPDGYLSPVGALVAALLEVALISLVFIVAQWWIARSVPLFLYFGEAVPRTLLWFQGAVVVAILPLVTGLTFASAAGAIAISGTSLGLLFLGIGVGSAATIFALLLFQVRGRLPTVSRQPASATYPAPAAVGGPIEVSCPACGENYRLQGVPLLAPHLGVSRFGSLYLRCPRCGERGWKMIVARVGSGAGP